MQSLAAIGSGLLVAAAMLAGVVQAAPTEQSFHSGLEKGASLPVFHPQHVTGTDRGTNTCPI